MPALQEFPIKGVFTSPIKTLYQLSTINYSPSMSVKVLIPTPLQNLTNNQAQLECSASSVDELIQALEESCPGIKARLCDDQGKPRRFLNFYVNSEDIRFLDGTNTPLQDGDEVSIVPAVAGG
jgi:molybdopterin converting factor small subunit